jgi:hypothetical protein
MFLCFVDDGQDSSQPEGLVWKRLKSIVGNDASPAILLVDLKDSIATKFLPPVVQEFRYGKKYFSVFNDSHEACSVCHVSVLRLFPHLKG